VKSWFWKMSIIAVGVFLGVGPLQSLWDTMIDAVH
jgi:hypothetical protein